MAIRSGIVQSLFCENLVSKGGAQALFANAKTREEAIEVLRRHRGF
jgi:hypothetical protein